MPLAVESLTPDSSMDAIRQAISDSIQKCMNEPGDVQNKQARCAAIAYEMARKATGKQLGGQQ